MLKNMFFYFVDKYFEFVCNPLICLQNLNADLTTMKKNGFIIKSERVSMAKIVRRINEYTICKIPDDLPHREIHMVEYWISR